MSRAIESIIAERERQTTVEGWTPAHDDTHTDGELAKAAACYALWSQTDWSAAKAQIDKADGIQAPGHWPWHPDWWKPKNRRRNLVRAGALIVAELERLDRAKEKDV